MARRAGRNSPPGPATTTDCERWAHAVKVASSAPPASAGAPCGTLRLVTLAILRLPDLAMIAQLMHMDNEDRVVLHAGCDVAGGALRLAHRALETHGRDVGYEIGAWIDDAVLTAAVELVREHDEVPVVIEQVRLATLALTQAAAAVPEDRMLVPDRLVTSLRHLLVI